MVELDETTPVFAIAAAAELAGMHPQTLRQYDRLGLVSPRRTAGRSRRYSMRDVVQLREVARLGSEGVSLEGIRRILELENQVTRLGRDAACSRRARKARWSRFARARASGAAIRSSSGGRSIAERQRSGPGIRPR
jgi:DNA-binding transcriptional MerR regulator